MKGERVVEVRGGEAEKVIREEVEELWMREVSGAEV